MPAGGAGYRKPQSPEVLAKHPFLSLARVALSRRFFSKFKNVHQKKSSKTLFVMKPILKYTF
jgi:hypothetical protein